MKQILFLLISLWSASVIAQNDPLYNQYLFNQGMINPAYNGINKVFDATAISRVQWAGISGAPITNTLNVSTSLLNDKMGGGVLFVSDQLGVNTTTEASVAVNYRILFRNSKLSFGMQGGTVSYRYDYAKLNTEVVDQKIVQQVNNYSRPTLGAGIFYKAEQFYLGVSVPRFLNVNVQDGVSNSTRYKRHLYLSGGYVFERFRAIKIKPSFLLRVVDNVKPSLDLNIQALFLEVLWAGVVLRDFNSVGLISQIQVGNRFRAGYLFELPTGKLAANNFGTHELMVSLNLDIFRNQVVYRRYF